MDWDDAIEEARSNLGYSKNEYIEDWDEVVEEAKELLDHQRDEEADDMSIAMKNVHIKYMQSDRWKTLRELKMYNNSVCELCNDKATQVHHKDYTLLFTPKEYSILISVCKKCHEKVHGLKNEK